MERWSGRHWEDGEVDKDDKRPRVSEVIKLLNAHFIAALDLNNDSLQRKSQQYNRDISGKMARWGKLMDVQMKSVTFKPSDPISIVSVLDIIDIAYDSNCIHEGAAVWLFSHSIQEPGKSAWSY